MSVALMSLKSEESKQLVNGKYRAFIEGHDIVITDGKYRWIVSQAEIADLEERLTNLINENRDAINEKANKGHKHAVSDVEGLTESINEKANVGHKHEAKDLIYQPEKGSGWIAEEITVKKAIDDLQKATQKLDKAGNKISVWDAIFGIGSTVVGTIVDGGLAAAVVGLQSQVATLESQMLAIGGTDITDTALGAIRNAADVGSDVGDMIDNIGGFAANFSRIRNTMRGYSRITTIGSNPLSGLVAL